MTRVGIITFHFSDNFGALMQAYGLREWLRRNGCEAEFINYHPDHVENGGAFDGLLRPGRFRRNLKVLYLKLSALQRRLLGNREQKELLDAFRLHELGVVTPTLKTRGAVETFLATPQGRFDVLVCGSDQIWSPSLQHGLDPVYFLAMKNAGGARRIAYAPSFGRASLEPAYRDEVRRCLEAVKGLSVREASGVQIVRELTGRSCSCVPDPTILLGDFSDLIAQSGAVDEGHVFCYALRTGTAIREATQIIAEATGRPIISPYNVHRRWKEIGKTAYPSPAGWAALIDRSLCVVTNSFHGAVFSILRQKPFLAIGLPGDKTDLNERVLHLLGQLDLSSRFIPADEIGSSRERMNAPIDWDDVGNRIEAMRATGAEYLKTQLAELRQ